MFPSLIDSDFSSLATQFLPVVSREVDPPWVFDWDQVWHVRVLMCSALLGVSAVLSSASGIGGGGMFVVLLMVVSGLTAHDAVPLSKIVVFAGAVASLCLNMLRSRSIKGDVRAYQSKAVIDGVACTLVVPAAIVGTYLGVVANTHASDAVIVALLNVMLIVLTVSVFRAGMRQRAEEDEASIRVLSATQVDPDLESEAVQGDVGSGFNPQDDTESEQDERRENRQRRDPVCAAEEGSPPSPAGERMSWATFMMDKFEVPKGTRLKLLTLSESSSGVILVVLVVLAGIMQFHFDKCLEELRKGSLETPSCAHPIARTMATWTSRAAHDPAYLYHVTEMFRIPIWGCCVMGTLAGLKAYHSSAWSVQAIILYQATSVCAGCLAGLIGIGGGLIFAPFFVVTGMESAVAVGTSATCVFFTSSSTTFQYLLEDRMIMSLAVVYSAVTAVGSLLGTRLVHNLQDRSTRKSHITFIVLGGIVVSLLLSMFKLGYMLRGMSRTSSQMELIMDEKWYDVHHG